MRKEPSHIKDVTKDIITRLTKENLTKDKRIGAVWDRAAGGRFRPHTKPVSFRRKRLVVNVDSSSWLYELSMRKRKIAANLKKMLKEEFGELRFRIGRIER